MSNFASIRHSLDSSSLSLPLELTSFRWNATSTQHWSAFEISPVTTRSSTHTLHVNVESSPGAIAVWSARTRTTALLTQSISADRLLPRHLALATTVNTVDRLRRLASTSTVRRSLLLRRFNRYSATKSVRAIIRFQSFIVLRVTHLLSPRTTGTALNVYFQSANADPRP